MHVRKVAFAFFYSLGRAGDFASEIWFPFHDDLHPAVSLCDLPDQIVHICYVFWSDSHFCSCSCSCLCLLVCLFACYCLLLLSLPLFLLEMMVMDGDGVFWIVHNVQLVEIRLLCGHRQICGQHQVTIGIFNLIMASWLRNKEILCEVSRIISNQDHRNPE